jgi:hypothetical protein
MAAKGNTGASLEPKHDHARGTGHEPLAGGDEEQQRAAQQKEEELQREAQWVAGSGAAAAGRALWSRLLRSPNTTPCAGPGQRPR